MNDGFEAILGGMETASAGPRDGLGRVKTAPGFWAVLGAMHAVPTAARPGPIPSDDPTTGDAGLQAAPSTDPIDIERDLAIRPGLSPAQLKSLRRSFARTNHPDRMPSQHRKASTIRMQIANRLIDEALRAPTDGRNAGT